MLSTLALQLQFSSVGDFGPIYTETQLGRFPVEPFNTFSNFIFLGIIIYFAWRTRFDLRRHPLIVCALPILLVGFIGGTVYHATRSDRIWLMLDYMPIIILAAFASIYFWSRVLGGFARGLLLGLIIFLSLRLVFLSSVPIAFKITLAYLTTALSILTPAVIYCVRSGADGSKLLASSAILFAAALGFRFFDQYAAVYITVGTHFLWHIFGGASVFLLMLFAFNDDRRASKQKND